MRLIIDKNISTCKLHFGQKGFEIMLVNDFDMLILQLNSFLALLDKGVSTKDSKSWYVIAKLQKLIQDTIDGTDSDAYKKTFDYRPLWYSNHCAVGSSIPIF